MKSFRFWLSTFFPTVDWSRALITADEASIICPSLGNKISGYLNSSAWGRDSSLTWRLHFNRFQLTTTTSYLEELTFIPVISLSAAPVSATSATLSAQSRDATLRFPNQTPSSGWWMSNVGHLSLCQFLSHLQKTNVVQGQKNPSTEKSSIG